MTGGEGEPDPRKLAEGSDRDTVVIDHTTVEVEGAESSEPSDETTLDTHAIPGYRRETGKNPSEPSERTGFSESFGLFVSCNVGMALILLGLIYSNPVAIGVGVPLYAPAFLRGLGKLREVYQR